MKDELEDAAQPPTAYITELKYYDDRRDGYLEIPLPGEIEELDELESELRKIQDFYSDDDDDDEDDDDELEKEDVLFPKLVKNKADRSAEGKEDDKGPEYIRIGLEEQGRHGRVIKADESSDSLSKEERKEREVNDSWRTKKLDYSMNIPVEYTKHNDSSPLHGYEDGGSATLEVDQENNEMRIYSPKGYRYRDRDLSEEGRKPVYKKLSLSGLSLSLVNIYADLAGIGTQKFRVIPFNAQHSLFRESGEGFDSETGQPDPDLFQEVAEKNRVPRYKAQTLKIYWDPDGLGYGMHSRNKVVHKDILVEEAEITLPAKGSFEIVTETWYGEQYTVLYHGEGLPNQMSWEPTDIGDWTGKYIEYNGREDCITVYAPCQTTSRILSKLREYFSM